MGQTEALPRPQQVTPGEMHSLPSQQVSPLAHVPPPHETPLLASEQPPASASKSAARAAVAVSHTACLQPVAIPFSA